MRIGVDTGGTFTDFVRVDRDGLTTHKVRSTPDDPSRAILEGLRALGGADAADVVHGSTVATNAVLERRGARVALVTTAGFEDVIHIGRQTRPELYNIFVKPRVPLVDRSIVFGIRERLDAGGQVVTPIDGDSLSRLVVNVQASGAEIAAVCLLHSYANPAHEIAVARALRAAGLSVCTSFEVLPEYREFERWSTTVVNAYVTPLMDRYLARLEASLGAAARLSVMQSNGGSISAAAARAQAVRTVLSGPAAGVVGARVVAAAAGYRNVISFDMGGTSTDVSLIDDRIRTTTDGRVGEFPVRLPVIDIHTVGAGGGSIATIDSGGALRVGPESAGAEPGPACYGTGTRMTVTDANLLVGRLDPDNFFGGRMTLDVSRSKAAAEPLAKALKVSVIELAKGVIRVANANMERAIRVVSVERGHDPRDFALLAFGGAGGMHACETADALEMKTVIVPRQAGVLSALGMLMADVTKDYTASVLTRASELSVADLEQRFAPLVAQGRRDLAKEGLTGTKAVCAKWVDVRYVGQSYEISLPFTPAYRRAFDALHGKTYGYSNPDRPVEVVNIRVVATGKAQKPTLSPKTTSGVVSKKRHPMSFSKGPKVITGPEATIYIPSNWKWRVDAMGNVICTR
ncbi:MAG: hydantoinase/oxoprolinase family protein [Acidobacteria bacterium]|nr:MAG: hydantoinase/oxoprolinase family protein [Acidobacteriota bacterium]